MIVEFDKSFSKSLDKIKDPAALQRTKKVILKLEKAYSLKDVKILKKLSGFKNYYRIGVEQIDNKTLRLIIIAHRKDIYKKFP